MPGRRGPGGYAGQARQRGYAGQECAGKQWHLCLGTGNRHVPFFRSCPRGVPRFRKYVSRAGSPKL